MKILALGLIISHSFAMAQTPQRAPAFIGGFFGGKPNTSGGNVMKCKQCSVPFSDENWVQFESLQKCSPERRYFQDGLMQIPAHFREKRDSAVGTQFPIACVVHAQRTLTFRTREKPEDAEPTKWSGYEVPSRLFARCEVSDGEPVRGAFMPCVTPEYAYSVYHALNDVADCFDIKARKVLPKLWNESGLHISALGGGLDGGVGQLTRSAIQEVLTPPFASDTRTALEIFKASATVSDKASCQRLIQYERAFDVVSLEPVNRCSIMATPDNPIRNLIYTGIFYKVNERFIQDRIERSGLRQRVLDLGISEPDMEFFNDVVLTLSFNAGRGTAFSLVDSFLKSRLANNQKLTRKDLDFLNSSIEEIRALRREPKDETEQARETRLQRLTQAREVAHRYTLPQFLRLMHGLSSDFETDPARKRINGAPGYLTFVADRQKKYDQELGEGVCTHDKFLQHR